VINKFNHTADNEIDLHQLRSHTTDENKNSGPPAPVPFLKEVTHCPSSWSNDPDRILKPIEVADILGVEVGTVWSWCRSGKLPHIRLSQRAFRIRSQDLQKFLASVTH
jgi:excisionase family DNA binding protein